MFCAKKINERNVYMDFLKGLAIVSVIVGHSISDVSEGYLLCNVIYSCHMPLLVFISAYIEEQNREKYMKKGRQMILKRVGGLLVPYVTWSVLYELISERLWEVNLEDFVLRLLGYKQTGLWFFPVLFGLKILHCLYWSIQKMMKNVGYSLYKNVLICCFLEFVIAFLALFTKQPYIINMLSYAIPYFLAVIIVDNAAVQKVMNSEWVIAGSLLVYLLLFPHFSFNEQHWTTQVIRIILSLCVIIVCCKYQTQWKTNCFNKILCTFGSYSLAIYVLHGFFADWVSYLNGIESSCIIAVFSVLSAFVIAGICVGIAKIIEISSWWGKVLFGKW